MQADDVLFFTICKGYLCHTQTQQYIMQNKKMTIQLAMAAFLTVSGMAMLIMGLWTPPVGEIHSSVLIAYGEVSTFAGSLFGIDYTYRYKLKKNIISDGQKNA